MDTIEIRKPDDFHLHLRRSELLRKVLPHTVNQFARGLIMPNTRPGPIITNEHVDNYRNEICSVLTKDQLAEFSPLMTIQITQETTPEIINKAEQARAIAAKIYPQGVTTNSENGVVDFRGLYPVFETMQELDMVLSLHGESPQEMVPGLEKEKTFLHTLRMIARDFPKLRIVLEHITTEDAVKCVLELPETVAATITVHHLFLTLDDVIGYSKDSKGLMQSHNFCKPIAKTVYDRAALRKVATSGNPKFFFGSDSAPHLKGSKECASVCAGVFTAPVALPLLCQMFEYLGHLEDRLEPFVSEFGAKFYRLPLNSERICCVKKEWIVPQEYDGIVPFMAGQKIYWQVET
ncbi:dihydroorotase [Patescibacteria group bacterium]|nr:dihydroorotase [Patescibacteria group bacterium]MBU4368082.1 dihydroorotase [Patescibacteria group bacterium]MBU4462311.1 dihydroorotase [Patescibacteria group bacterium]MCG2700360.1 dihydroorotase [Candidatus Parcubacteria bacterium]